jgi:hypothetical protein
MGYHRPSGGWILNIMRKWRITKPMKPATFLFTLALGMAFAMPLFAAGCYADYKAKQDGPLRLHYGVAQINGACDASSAASELAPRLNAEGWTLLNVISTFAEDGLDQRKDSAGQNYLRF